MRTKTRPMFENNIILLLSILIQDGKCYILCYYNPRTYVLRSIPI